MANWDEEQDLEDARSIYRDRVKVAGAHLINQAKAFQNNFDAIRNDPSLSAENQTLMDAKHTQLVSGLKTALGIA